MTDTNIKDTRCFIDFDGTIANSLEWCNVALDEMFMGTLTDKHYIEYYKDFGDSHDIIPGCPWKDILARLCIYHSSEKMIGARDMSNPIMPITICYDLGPISAMLKVAYGVEFTEHDVNNIAYYRSENMLIGVVLNEIATMDDLSLLETQADVFGISDWKLLPITGYFAKTDVDFDMECGRFLYIEDVENKLDAIFENKVLRIMSERTFDELAIAPTIEFCRRYKSAGGSLVIQSGSNPAIISKITDVLGITELFDGMFCSPVVNENRDVMGKNQSPWEYKTAVIVAALDMFGDGRKSFVIGDTKGDAFGAYENNLPFMLVWRGYPSNPTHLDSGDGTLVIEDWVDFSQNLLEAQDLPDFEADIKSLMNFANKVGCGRAAAPVLETE